MIPVNICIVVNFGFKVFKFALMLLELFMMVVELFGEGFV
jgi:hypothetical protein